MRIPEGMKEFGVLPQGITTNNLFEHALLLDKAIYGLLQSARAWWLCLKKFLLAHEFQECADFCLFYRNNEFGTVVFIVYVDDGGIFGDDEAVDNCVEQFKQRFNVKVDDTLTDYLGCEIIRDGNKPKIWIRQPNLLSHIAGNFSEYLPTKHVGTPGTPKFVVIRHVQDDANLLSPDEQSKFRTGVGMLMHLVKYSRPEIANAVRECSKVLDGATKRDWNELMRIMKFVISTAHYGLKVEPKLTRDSEGNCLFMLEGLCDAAYASDKETRHSVMGYILYFCNVPIVWRSKSQKAVTLSTTESEYVSISELVKDIMFVKQILESLNIEVQLPILVKVDNVGAIYLATQNGASQRTKHVDIRYHYVRELVIDGIVKVIFVKTKENDSDIFTKNVNLEPFEKHMFKMVEKVPMELLYRS
jgi:hypothetical protein